MAILRPRVEYGNSSPWVEYGVYKEEYLYSSLLRREECTILILLICESIGLLSQLFLGKNRLNNDVHKENVRTLMFMMKYHLIEPETK